MAIQTFRYFSNKKTCFNQRIQVVSFLLSKLMVRVSLRLCIAASGLSVVTEPYRQLAYFSNLCCRTYYINPALLLDTHILLWSLSNSKKLPTEMRRSIERDSNELWLSPITTWEILMLIEKEKIHISHNEPTKWMKNILKTLPIKSAPLNHEVAIKSRQIKLPHQDPADRFIVATAIVYNLVLLTIDEKIIANDHHNVCYTNNS